MKMNYKRLLSLAGVTYFCLAGAFAAGNEKGIEYYRAELYDAAKIFFVQQTNQSTIEKAENYYYLGQIYAATEKIDSAAVFYQKALDTDVEYAYGYIGQGRLALAKNDAKGAEDLFKKAIGFAKKDPAIYTTVAEAYIHVKQYDKAEETLDRARKVKKDYSGIFVAEGDMLMSQGKVGEASSRYDNAIAFDKGDKVAYLKQARVYKTINPDFALKYLNDLVGVDPNYIPAYAELGEINYSTGFYGKAIEAYEKFIAIPGVPLTHQAKYAQLLYFTDKYAESLAEIRKVLAVEPDNFVMHRLQAYNNFKLGNTTLALEQMNKFMGSASTDKLIPLDYITYGRILLKEKQPEMAIHNLKKATEVEGTKPAQKLEIYKDIANAYESVKDYVNAIPYYELFMEDTTQLQAKEYLLYGLACYYAADQLAVKDTTTKSSELLAADSIKRVEVLHKADKAFEQVTIKSPTSYQGFYHRGNVNAMMDNDHVTATHKMPGLAKPYYEQALTILLENNEGGSRNRYIIDCYRYLAYYYLLLEDTKTSGEYWKKILEIDPTNELAKQTLETLKIKI